MDAATPVQVNPHRTWLRLAYRADRRIFRNDLGVFSMRSLPVRMSIRNSSTDRMPTDSLHIVSGRFASSACEMSSWRMAWNAKSNSRAITRSPYYSDKTSGRIPRCTPNLLPSSVPPNPPSSTPKHACISLKRYIPLACEVVLAMTHLTDTSKKGGTAVIGSRRRATAQTPLLWVWQYTHASPAG